MAKLYSKKITLLVVFFLSIVSCVYIFLTIKSASQKKTLVQSQPPKITATDSKISNLTAQKATLDPNASLPQKLPPTLPVYKVEPGSEIDVYSMADKIAQNYKLKISNFSTNYWNSSDNSISFYYDKVNKSVNYSIIADTLPNYYWGNSPPTSQTAIIAAQNFLKNNSLFSDYSILQSQISYFIVHEKEPEFEVAQDSKDANIISIPFTQNFNDFPYRYESNLTSPLVVFIGQQNKIIKFIFTPQPLPKTISSKDYYTLTSSETIEALNTGSASVVYAPLYNIPPNTRDLPPVIVTKIEIEYRFDSKTSSLAPYFLITGHFIAPNSKSNTIFPVILLLPAVKI